MDTRRIRKTINELKASHARLDALAAETADIEARIAAQKRTQRWLLLVALLLMTGTAAGAVWLVRTLS